MSSKLLSTSMSLSDMNKHAGSDIGYCPYMQVDSTQDTYKTFTESMLAQDKTTTEEILSIPPSLPNGGLYNASQVTAPWGSIPVVPTDSNIIHLNLRSAQPPPGATEQYVSTNRLGNNYTSKVGVYAYNPPGAKNGMYRMDVTKKSDEVQY